MVQEVSGIMAQDFPRNVMYHKCPIQEKMIKAKVRNL